MRADGLRCWQLESEAMLRFSACCLDALADITGIPALMAASIKCDVEIVQMLSDAGAETNLESNHGMTALMGAAINGRVEIARMLLNAGAKQKLVTNRGTTAFIAASAQGSVHVIRVLLDAGADKNLADNYGNGSLSQEPH